MWQERILFLTVTVKCYFIYSGTAIHCCYSIKPLPKPLAARKIHVGKKQITRASPLHIKYTLSGNLSETHYVVLQRSQWKPSVDTHFSSLAISVQNQIYFLVSVQRNKDREVTTYQKKVLDTCNLVCSQIPICWYKLQLHFQMFLKQMQNKYLDAKHQGLGQDTYLPSSDTFFASSRLVRTTSSVTENKRGFLSRLVYLQ